jgi:hypothetical protein
MTESKQDIQAQIDELGADWNSRASRTKKYGVVFRRDLPKKKPYKHEVLIGSIVWVSLSCFFAWRSSQGFLSGDGGWSELLFVLLYILLVFSSRSDARRSALYFSDKESYESKRAELQAKLDALD